MHTIYDTDGPVATLTFNRPEARNALTFQMYRDLAKVCEAVGQDEAVRALILSAAGEKAFASGTDIKEFQAFAGAEDAIVYEREIGAVLTAVEACSVPTIAALSGACAGGGFAIAACCDIRIAQDNLRLGLPIARTLGNCLSIETIARFKALVGQARLTELIFTARLMPAAEALSAGVVSEVWPDRDALDARAVELARIVASQAPTTLGVTKEALRRLRRETAPSDDDLIRRAYGSQDFREGLAAFLDKRAPMWVGK